MSYRTGLASLGLFVITGLVAGCASDSTTINAATTSSAVSDVRASDAGASRSALVELMQRRSEMGRQLPQPSLRELLERGSGMPAFDVRSVAIGTIVDVRKDVGWVALPDEEIAEGRSDGILVDFDDPDAQWQLVIVTLRIEEVIDGRRPLDGVVDGATVEFAFPSYPSLEFEVLRSALVTMGRVAAPLVTAVFEHLPHMATLPGDSDLLIVISETGELSVPFVEQLGPSPLGDLTQLAQLVALGGR